MTVENNKIYQNFLEKEPTVSNTSHRGKQLLMAVIYNKPNIIDRKQEKGHYNMIVAFLF